MIRLVVVDMSGAKTLLSVKEIISINGVKYGEEAAASGEDLLEVVNRVKILEALVQPLVDVLVNRPEPSPPVRDEAPASPRTPSEDKQDG